MVDTTLQGNSEYSESSLRRFEQENGRDAMLINAAISVLGANCSPELKAVAEKYLTRQLAVSDLSAFAQSE